MTQRVSPRVAVIGAGPAGATAALVLARRGVSVDLFEATESVGGLARTIELWNQRVDLGPHRFFSSDRRVNSMWLSVVGGDYAMVDRLTRILYRGRLFHYPLSAGDALRGLGGKEALRCVFDYALQQVRPTPDDGSFEAWVVRRFGRRLYEIFFRTYSEKLWGIPCSELDADFAAQRIKKLSLGAAITNALRAGRGNRHKTLVDRFAYPLQGTGVVYERMAAEVERRGGGVRLNTPIGGMIVEDGRVCGVVLASGEELPYDSVISSMPITLLLNGLPSVPADISAAARRLRFRNTIIVYLRVSGGDHFPDQWVYVHSRNLRMGRLTSFRNWTPELYGQSPETITASEYWSYEDEDLWKMNDDALIRLAREELHETGLVGRAEILDGHVERIPRCYPVYERGYRTHLQPIQEYLSSIDGLSVIGRYGSFKYNNQDHSILMGLLAAENIVDGEQNDLWAVIPTMTAIKKRL